MKIAVLTTKRLQSLLLLANLMTLGIKPEFVVFLSKNTNSKQRPFVTRWKLIIKRIVFRETDLDKIQSLRKKYQKDADFLLSKYLKDSNLNLDLAKTIKAIETEDINDSKITNALIENKIEYALIWGVPLVNKTFINSVSRGVLNAHTSILPEYRGSRVEFWQFYYNDFPYAGITIHFVNEYVDKGDILFQQKAERNDLKNPELLRAANSVRIIKAFPEVLKNLYAENITPIKQSSLPEPKTPTFRYRDIGLKELKKVYLKEA